VNAWDRLVYEHHADPYFSSNKEGAFVGRVGGTITPIFMGMTVIVNASSGILLMIGALLLVPLFQKKRKANVTQNY
jgi:MFS transporter, DHA3 family, macrolide efflux protein